MDTVAVPVEVEHAVAVPVADAGVQEPETAAEAPSPAEQAAATVDIIEAEGEAAVARIEAEGEAAVAVAEVMAADQEVREDVGELQQWQGTVEGRLSAIETSLSSISVTLGEIAAATIPAPEPETTPQSDTPQNTPLVNPGAASAEGQGEAKPSDVPLPETVLRERRFRRI